LFVVIILALIPFAPLALYGLTIFTFNIPDYLGTPRNCNSPILENLFWSFLKIVIITPIIETVLLIVVLKIILKFTKRIIVVCLISGLIWGIGHGFMYSHYIVSFVFPGNNIM
jgi:hypothetical protein